MKEIVVEILQGDFAARLAPGPNDIALADGDALVSISGTRAPFLLNERPLRLQGIDSGTRLGTLRLANRPGLHRLSLRSSAGSIDFDFATTTAKAAWAEVEAMVQATRLYSLGKGRPFLYLGADGVQQVESLQEILFWLSDRWRELEELTSSVDRAPAARKQPRLRTVNRAKGIDLRATAALLRERPTLLEETIDGGIALGTKRYWPSLVRVRSSEPSIPQAEHRQLRTLLARLLSVCRSLSPVLPEAKGFVPGLTSLLQLRTLGNHTSGPGEAFPSLLESEVERRDTRYRRLRHLEREFQLKFFHLSDPATSIRAGLRDAWEIYQAFVAHTIGRALGLDYVSDRRDLLNRDSSGASMRGHGLRLFYDVRAPGEHLTSWRDASSRPALERPDILVIDEAREMVLVLDVKFSIGDDGQCRSEHLFEMQGYLNSYRLRAGGIVFPGQASAARDISDGDFTLAEIPLRAEALLESGGTVLDELRDRLDSLWEPLPSS